MSTTQATAGGVKPPVTAILFTCMFLTGVSFAATAPYRSVLAVDTLGMSNSLFAILVTISAIGTALASLVLGNLSDKLGDRRLTVIFCAVSGAVAYGAIYLFPNIVAFSIAFCLILPFGGALFSQSFTFSRTYYDQHNPDRSEFMVSALRTLFTVAWIVVPPAAGWVAATFTVFEVFGVAAVAHVLFTLVFGILFLERPAKVAVDGVETAAPLRLPMNRILGLAGVTFIRTATMVHVITIPLAIITDFGGDFAFVGINAGIAAAIEVPFMLGWGLMVSRFSKETIIVFNAVLFATYFALLALWAESVWHVLWLQGLNAIATAALLSITISYTQEAIKGRVGLSTSLFDVMTVLSATGSASLFALFATEVSYTTVFLAGAAVCLAGAALLAVSARMSDKSTV